MAESTAGRSTGSTENETERAAGGTHAVVLGGGMAGLLAARVLSDHAGRVTLVERDRLPDGAQPRRGVPQGRHAHGLLGGGEAVLARLFPGLTPALRDAGATIVDMGADIRWHHLGGTKVQFPSGIVAPMASRPFLEGEVRRRVVALPNVSALPGHEAVGLLASEDGQRVAGVTVREAARGQGGQGGHGERRLVADLVVDATGRGSRAPAWLEALDYPAPAVSEVKIGVAYTSRIYRRTPGDVRGAKMVLSTPAPPGETRMAVLLPIEGERWLLSLVGWLGDHAPADEAGFLDFARSVGSPDVARIVDRAEPLGDSAVHKVPSNLRHHYERLDRVPEGFLVTGDAVCSFNPTYGQGMTVAALEAEALEAGLREGAPGPGRAWTGLPRRFYRRAAGAVDAAWLMATGEDFRYPDVIGSKPPATDLVNWYLGRVHRATLHDPVVYRAFLEAMAMLQPPAVLFHPRIVARALRPSVAGWARLRPLLGRRGADFAGFGPSKE